jgi:hypothetical protein
MVRAGARSCRLGGVSIVDVARGNRVPSGTTFGWFLLRIVVNLNAAQFNDLKDKHGIPFTSTHMVQPGWFKVYLNEQQLSYLRTIHDQISVIPVKPHVQPNFADLAGESSFLVEAADDWQPSPPIRARRTYAELYLVSGATAEELFADPKVVSVRKRPKLVFHSRSPLSPF